MYINAVKYIYCEFYDIQQSTETLHHNEMHFFSEMQFFFTRKMKIVEKSKYPHSIQVSADSFAQVSGIRRQLCPGIRYPQTAFPKYPQSIQVSMCHPVAL